MASRYWVGGDGTWDNASTTNWSATSGGAAGASAPTTADDAIFDSASGTGTCTVAATAACRDTTVNSSTLVLSYGANCTLTRNLILTLGTINVNGNTITAAAFSSTNSNVRAVNFGTNGKFICSSATAPWNTGTATNLTISGTGTLDCTDNTAGTRSILFGTLAESSTINVNVLAGTGTVGLTGSVKNLDFTGFAGTLSNGARTIYGNLIVSSGMTCTAGTSATTFAATSGTQQITTNANATIDFPITFNGVGGTFQLQDNLTIGSTRTVTLTNGTLDLNSKTVSCGIFSSSNSNTRSIAFGTGNITLTGSGATIWNTSTVTGLTYTGTPVVNATYAGSTGTRTLSCGTAGAVPAATCASFNISAGTDAISGLDNVNNLDFTGFAGTWNQRARYIYGNLTVAAGITSGFSSGVCTFAATSGTKTITTNNLTLGFPITFNGIGGTWSFADALTQDSTYAFTITNGTVKLKAGATSTVGAFATSGSNQKYLQSTTAGSQATLSQASGTVNASYLTIKDINATGGAIWNAYRSLGNIDAGNNTGWDFLSTPVTTTTLAMRLGFGL